MIKGMVKHELLKTSDGVLRLAEDTLCGGCFHLVLEHLKELIGDILVMNLGSCLLKSFLITKKVIATMKTEILLLN